jgi:hypothetical protein
LGNKRFVNKENKEKPYNNKELENNNKVFEKKDNKDINSNSKLKLRARSPYATFVIMLIYFIYSYFPYNIVKI